MAIRISDKHDTMVLSLMAGRGMSAANRDTLLQNIKTWLDANVASYKDGSGNYTVPHVIQAMNAVLSRGK
jgi:hypothetical protein